MTNHSLKHKTPKESGAVLITGMIFLVVLTIIVISAMRSATLEERMSANARNRQLALQAAEAVLRDAEVNLFAAAPFDPFTPSSFTSTCANGFCTVLASATPYWQSINWTTANSRSFAATTSELDDLPSQPRYIVEIVSAEPPGAGLCGKVLYRITARGMSNDSSTVFLQTMVRRLPASC